jgi:cytochrome oxidase Cu insertion factor (SCO1/SenC/PrrC family)
MEKLLMAAILPILLSLRLTAPSEPLPIGADLPKADVILHDVSGKSITLKDARKEKGLLVMFSCNTCPTVIANQQRTTAIANFAHQQDVGVILLNSNEDNRNGADSPEAMKKYADNQQYKWYYAIDKNSELADAFGANRTPECYLFDKNGKLVYHGAIDDNPQDESNIKRQHLREAITEMNAGKPVSVTNTRSIGCSIKRK